MSDGIEKPTNCKYWAVYSGVSCPFDDPFRCSNDHRYREEKELRSHIHGLTWINTEKSIDCPSDCKYFKTGK